jgi:ferrous iron transport protein A
MTAAHHWTSLRSLRCGQVADICQIAGPPEQVRRLEELGLRRGARIELVRGGSPCIVRVDGATFCFRNDDLLSVLVAPRMSA